MAVSEPPLETCLIWFNAAKGSNKKIRQYLISLCAKDPMEVLFDSGLVEPGQHCFKFLTEKSEHYNVQPWKGSVGTEAMVQHITVQGVQRHFRYTQSLVSDDAAEAFGTTRRSYHKLRGTCQQICALENTITWVCCMYRRRSQDSETNRNAPRQVCPTSNLNINPEEVNTCFCNLGN